MREREKEFASTNTVNTLDQIINKLNNKYIKNIAITSHVSPDGDAIGSSVALALGLESIGKRTKVFTSGFSDIFIPLMKNVNYSKKLHNTYDVTILLDCSNISRTVNYLEDLSKHLIVIDHHIGCQPIGNIYLCKEKASTTMIIYELLQKMNIPITPNIATALYLGIVGDTSWFSNTNVTEEAHRITADLLRNGANLSIVNNIYCNKSIGAIKLISEVFSQIVIDSKYNIAYAVLMKDRLQHYGVKYDISEYLINMLKNIEGIDIAFLFIESKNDTRIKARSKTLDIHKLMEYFNGGGHMHAAGAIIDSVNTYYIVDNVIAQTKLYIDQQNMQ